MSERKSEDAPRGILAIVEELATLLAGWQERIDGELAAIVPEPVPAELLEEEARLLGIRDSRQAEAEELRRTLRETDAEIRRVTESDEYLAGDEQARARVTAFGERRNEAEAAIGHPETARAVLERRLREAQDRIRTHQDRAKRRALMLRAFLLLAEEQRLAWATGDLAAVADKHAACHRRAHGDLAGLVEAAGWPPGHGVPWTLELPNRSQRHMFNAENIEKLIADEAARLAAGPLIPED
ncbi:MAG: hypothetical protein HY321_12360 [Armatimonadetes bacterium]|nr:hypothetical protein [Armatimonadota bacterium]